MLDLREAISGTSSPDPDVDPDESARTLAGIASKLVFVALLIILAIAAASAGPVVGAIVIAPLVGSLVYVLLPIEAMRARADWLRRGDAGEDAYDYMKKRGSDVSDRLRRDSK